MQSQKSITYICTLGLCAPKDRATVLVWKGMLVWRCVLATLRGGEGMLVWRCVVVTLRGGGEGCVGVEVCCGDFTWGGRVCWWKMYGMCMFVECSSHLKGVLGVHHI